MANVRRATIYVDSSSTDKGAADKTDEVYLEVLCLTGEGVTLSVPRSILGYDLRRLVSEKFPWKPGAKLAMFHENRKLNLDQTLREQGIVEKSAVLSCTYMPTILYTAWRYVSELLTCEREFALEGVFREQSLESIYIICPAALQHCVLAANSPKLTAGVLTTESSDLEF